MHEFLPHEVDDFHEVAKSLNISIDDLKQRVRNETNPMLATEVQISNNMP